MMHYRKRSELTEERKMLKFVHLRHSLEKIIQTHSVVKAVFNVVSLSYTKELKLGGQF